MAVGMVEVVLVVVVVVVVGVVGVVVVEDDVVVGGRVVVVVVEDDVVVGGRVVVVVVEDDVVLHHHDHQDRKSTRLNSSHGYSSYAVFCLKKKTTGAGRTDTSWDG